jgi:RHS repeat-associated protein
MSLDTGFDAQVPSLPDAGGVSASLGETFSPEPSTGCANFTVRIDTPNGPNDIGPRLALVYDSSAGNGAFGLGFGLPLPRIVRSIARGYPRYDASDALILEGAGELLALPDATLRPVVDGGAWRIARQGDGFRLMDRAGVSYTLGTSPDARLSDAAAGGAEAFAWHLERIEDALGNAVDFTWTRDANQLYLGSVAYGAFLIDFMYEARPDALRWGRPGFLVTTAQRCAQIELRRPGAAQPALRRWQLRYAQHESNGGSLLTAIRMTGIDAAGNALDAPALTLGYSTAASRKLSRVESSIPGTQPGPLKRSDRRVELIDWFGTGLPDLLEISGGGQARVWPNAGGLRWGAPRSVGALPAFADPDAAIAFVDMDGDGMADIVRADRPLSGYVPRTRSGFQRPVGWARAPARSPMDSVARLADIDGDGAADLIVSDGNTLAIYYRDASAGWVPRPQVVPRDELTAAGLGDPHVFLADMTGSGSADLVRVDGGGVTYWPALGRGRWGDAIRMAHPPVLPFDVVPDRLFLQDIDGDGCADLVYLDRNRVCYWINQCGCGFSEMRSIDFLPVAEMSEVRWADMAGTGANGLLWSATLGGRCVYFFLDFVGGTRPYLLDTIDNGSGLVTTAGYSTSARECARDRGAGQAWQSAMPIVLPVVTSVTRRDSATNLVSREEYRYHDGRYDGLLRDFAGFGHVESIEVGDGNAPSLVRASWFHNGTKDDGSEPATRDERMALRAVRGRMRRQDRLSPDGTAQQDLPFDSLEQTWSVVTVATAAGTIWQPRLTKSVRSVFERMQSPSVVHTTTNISWDANGNVTDSTETHEAPGSGLPTPVLRTHCDFAADAQGRFISLPARTRQFDGAGTLIADAITEYDHAPEGTVGAQGLVTQRTALALTEAIIADAYGATPPDFSALGYFQRPGEAGWWVTLAAYTRTDDGAGLRGTTTDPMGSVTRFAFNAERTFPVSVTNAVGNATTAVYDERVGRPALITDASGSRRTARYDALARLVAEIDEGDSESLPTLALTYDSASVPVTVARAQRAVSGAAAVLVSRELFDGTGRLTEKRELDAAGEVVVLSRRYCARGMIARAWQPFRRPSAAYADPGDTVPSTQYFYDAIGRLIRVVNADGSFRTTAYTPLAVEDADEEDTRTDPAATHRGTSTRKRLDAAGRVLTVEQNLSGRTLASHYEYDLKGNLVRHLDEAGNEVAFWFDLLGRQLRVRRPECDSSVVRDAAGRPVELRRAGAPSVFREFDAIGRPVAVRTGDAKAAPVHRFTYHDNAAPAPANAGQHTSGGRLVRVDDEAGSTVFDYDGRGRQSLRRWQPAAGGRRYEINIDYRADGRVASVTYPDGGAGRLQARNVYDARGRLVGVPSVAPAIEVDLLGQVTRLQYANGTSLATVYDGATGRAASRALTSPAGWQRTTGYAWDKVGNLLAITSPDDGLAFDYTYDDLYRLTGATTPRGEQFAYRYADNGAMTFKSDVGEYAYGERGAPATCLTTAGTQALSYGPAGDVVAAPWGEQTFDALGRMRRIARNGSTLAEYVHDWTGRRVIVSVVDAQGSATTRLTPDPLYSIEGGTLVLNLFAGSQLLARRREGAAIAYLHYDHLGSLVAVSDQSGALVDSMRYDPFGKRIGIDGAGPSLPVGFTGGDPDPQSGLLYLQARYYHPGLGVFISPDPVVQDAMLPIAWTAYVYCGNNPTTRIDPTGMSFNLGKFIVGVVAVTALVALVVVSAGTLSPAAIAVVAFGAATGGLIGGITVAREESQDGRSPDFWDVVLGATVGAAVGGWAAYASVYGAAEVGKLAGEGLGHTVFGSNDVLSGALNNLVTQTAAGFAHAVAKPIAGTGATDWSELAQSAIAGAVSGAVQGALFGGFNTRDISDEQQEKYEADAVKESFTGKLSPGNIPWGWRVTGALIVSTEQVATSQIEWHPNFYAGTAENASGGTGFDVLAGFFATVLYMESF